MSTLTIISLIVLKTNSNCHISAFLSAGGNVSICQQVCSGLYYCSLFLPISAPGCVSFPVSPAGLCSLSSAALVGCGGKSAQCHSHTRTHTVDMNHPSLADSYRLHRWPLWWPASSSWWRWSYLMWVSPATCCFLGRFINRRRSAVTSFFLRLGSLHVTFLMFCSFRTARPPALKILCPGMLLATCYRSRRSW